MLERLGGQRNLSLARGQCEKSSFFKELLRHPKFGVGRVEDIGSLSVLVRFSDNATRRLTHAGK